jgi:hypothetical protein
VTVETRERLIAEGLIKPVSTTPEPSSFRNAGGRPILRLDQAGRDAVSRPHPEIRSEREFDDVSRNRRFVRDGLAKLAAERKTSR